MGATMSLLFCNVPLHTLTEADFCDRIELRHCWPVRIPLPSAVKQLYM